MEKAQSPLSHAEKRNFLKRSEFPLGVGKPTIEFNQFLGRNIGEGDTLTEAGAFVDDCTERFEDFIVVDETPAKLCSGGIRVKSVHVATGAARLAPRGSSNSGTAKTMEFRGTPLHRDIGHSQLQSSQHDLVDPPGEARVWRAKLNSSWAILEDALCEVCRKSKFGPNSGVVRNRIPRKKLGVLHAD